MSFWGATVSASKPFEESVPTNANLIVSHVTLAGQTDGTTTLSCTVEGIDGDFVVAHLNWGRVEQTSVDLVFPLGSDVKFSVKGKGEVHLLGMYDPVDDMNMGYSDSDEEGMMFGSEDSDLEGEEDSDEELRAQYGTGRGPKISELPEGASDDEDEDSDEDQGAPVQVQQKKPQQQQGKPGQQGQKQGGQQGQKQGGQQGQKQGGQQGQKQGGQQGQKQGGQQGQQQKQGQKRQIPIQDVSGQPQQKKQKTAEKELSANNNDKSNKNKDNVINLKCQPCDQMFASKASLDQHKRAKHPKRK